MFWPWRPRPHPSSEKEPSPGRSRAAQGACLTFSHTSSDAGFPLPPWVRIPEGTRSPWKTRWRWGHPQGTWSHRAWQAGPRGIVNRQPAQSGDKWGFLSDGEFHQPATCLQCLGPPSLPYGLGRSPRLPHLHTEMVSRGGDVEARGGREHSAGMWCWPAPLGTTAQVCPAFSPGPQPSPGPRPHHSSTTINRSLSETGPLSPQTETGCSV